MQRPHLGSALRFGNPSLIQDVEHLVPISDTMLNGETRRTDSRILIHLANQDIDFSTSLTVFLSISDSSVGCETCLIANHLRG
ncbi:hypothetical protein EDB19DRAFT_1745638 [Suillus lakei]|nr:hypothetical protein EDB19DRAFT_1745638 [Suillus lakei]